MQKVMPELFDQRPETYDFHKLWFSAGERVPRIYALEAAIAVCEAALIQGQPDFKILTIEQVQNLLCCAIEGGSNYWYLLHDTQPLKEGTPEMKGQPLVDRLFDFVWNKGGSVQVNDWEDEDEVLGQITRESLVKAETLMLEEHASHFADVLKENEDADTGDVFFQLAVMGKVTYG